MNPPIDASRRNVLQLAAAGFAVSALAPLRLARGQVPEEANSEALTLLRKGMPHPILVTPFGSHTRC